MVGRRRDLRVNSTARCASGGTGHTFQSGRRRRRGVCRWRGHGPLHSRRRLGMQGVMPTGADRHAVQELTAPGKRLDRLPTWQGRSLRLLRSAWAPPLPLCAARSAEAGRWRW